MQGYTVKIDGQYASRPNEIWRNQIFSSTDIDDAHALARKAWVEENLSVQIVEVNDDWSEGKTIWENGRFISPIL